MKKLRVAFLVTVFPQVSETFIVNQIIDLIDRGHDVKIFAFQKGDIDIVHNKLINYNLFEKTVYFQEYHESKIKRFFPFFKFITNHYKNINFKRLIQNIHFKRDGIKSLNLRFFYRWKWVLKEGDFDVFHAHFGKNGVYIAEIKSQGFLKNTKLITTFHGYDLNPRLLPQYQKQYANLIREADLLTVNTEFAKSLLRHITNSKKVKILPVGLDTSEFKPVERIGDNFHLLFVGRLIPLKAPELTLEIMRQLIKKGYLNIKLTIVGEGKLFKNLEESIQKYKLKNYVSLKGSLSQEAVKDIMQDADAFIMPGIYDKNGRAETQGLVIQEAQAMSLPIIISDVGGMKYGVLEDKTGYIVKANDVDAFVEKIEILLQNKELRKVMGKHGREFVVENYDSKVLGDQLEKYYFSL